MSFIADKQTLDDLGLLGKFKPHSIYSLFNKVRTSGGERLMDEMFHKPMTDAAQINKRSSIFRYFQEQKLTFPFRHEPFRVVENYLGSGTSGNAVTATAGMLRKKMMGSFLRDEQYNQLQEGLSTSIDALNALKDLIAPLNIDFVQPAKKILSDSRLAWIAEERGVKNFPVIKSARYDNMLRNSMRDEMETLLDVIYQLDVYIAVSTVARERNFYYAEALSEVENVFSTTALRHPGLEKAVANPVSLHQNDNLIFLTGANMAGKSTLMKSFGIAVYLGHMGFPVAAKDMRFSVRDGLYTSINVPDNLNMGYSHFYAEVLRVKIVAEEVSSGKNMIVIFDELFKGTNVKDAYDATLACTVSFSKYRNCFFIISTHIIEVGEALKQLDNVQFRYLPTVMEGNVPKYTYNLSTGITSDRQGMIIIENEKILDVLNA